LPAIKILWLFRLGRFRLGRPQSRTTQALALLIDGTKDCILPILPFVLGLSLPNKQSFSRGEVEDPIDGTASFFSKQCNVVSAKNNIGITENVDIKSDLDVLQNKELLKEKTFIILNNMTS
jgi:hypothetical protein